MAAIRKVPGRLQLTLDERVQLLIDQALPPLEPSPAELRALEERLIGERIVDRMTPAQRRKLEKRLDEGRRWWDKHLRQHGLGPDGIEIEALDPTLAGGEGGFFPALSRKTRTGA